MAVMDIAVCMLNCVDSTTVLVFILTFGIFVLLTRRDSGVPPGPPVLPIIGNLMSLASKDSLNNLAELRRKYGDIYALYIGKELTVFLNGYDMINDAILKKGSMFSRRPDSPFGKIVNTYPAIVAANDKLWKEQRTFTQRAMQQLCFKNKSQFIETIIVGEANKLLDKIESFEEPVNPARYLVISVANVISNFIMSQSFELNDAEFIDFWNKVSNTSRYLPRLITLINCFPFLATLPGDILDLNSVYEGVHSWRRIFEKYTHHRKFDGAQDDFVDIYMTVAKENETNGFNKTLTVNQLSITTFDLICAGSDTSATTLRWLLLYILNNPELEHKLHSEIDNVIGNERKPSLEDRAKMPYVEATILEALRIANVAPLAVPHSVPHDVVYKGFLIPKDTTVIANLNSVMMDPTIWKEPTLFQPERFLASDGKSLYIPKEFIPFSLGPRSCLGETLAKMEIFLFLTSILQRFKLEYPGSEPPIVKGNLGVTYDPIPYDIHFIKRK